MRKGRIRITNSLISDALGFPVDWEIEEIIPSGIREGESLMVVSGSDFPNETELGEIEDVRLIVHKESVKFEVEKI